MYSSSNQIHEPRTFVAFARVRFPNTVYEDILAAKLPDGPFANGCI